MVLPHTKAKAREPDEIEHNHECDGTECSNNNESSLQEPRSPPPVLSLSKDASSQDEYDDVQDLCEAWKQFCQTQTKEETAQVQNMFMTKQVLKEEEECPRTEMMQEEDCKPQVQGKVLAESIKEGDVRAYLTRGLNLVQSTSPVFVPGSKVFNVEINPAILNSPTVGKISIVDSILESVDRAAPKTPVYVANHANDQEGPKLSAPGSKVFEEEEADQDENALYGSCIVAFDATPSRPPKKRRLNTKQKPPTQDGQEVTTPNAATMETEIVPRNRKKHRLTPKRNPSPKEGGDAPHTVQQEPQAAAIVVQPPPFRHVLLGNASVPDDTDEDTTTKFKHPQHCSDTQTDGVLSSVEMEFAWLCEESLLCFEGKDVCWTFIYDHASYALQVELRKETELVRPDVQEATNLKRQCIRDTLLRGYRRPVLAKTIALHRMALRQGISVEKLREKMALQKRNSHARKGVVSPVKKASSVMKHVREDKKPKAANCNEVEPQSKTSKILTKIEEELAWLVEESIMQNIFDGIDHDYILNNASPSLRAAMKRHSRRWMPRLVRLHLEEVKEEFELQKFRIRQRLYLGYRRPETQSVLPVGRVTCSQFHEQQSRQAP